MGRKVEKFSVEIMIPSAPFEPTWRVNNKEEIFETHEDNHSLYECCLITRSCQSGNDLMYEPSDESLHCIESPSTGPSASLNSARLTVGDCNGLGPETILVEKSVDEAKRPKSPGQPFLQPLVTNDGQFMEFAKFDRNFRLNEEFIEDSPSVMTEKVTVDICEKPLEVRVPISRRSRSNKLIFLKNVNPEFQECSSCTSSMFNIGGVGGISRRSSCVTMASFDEYDEKNQVDQFKDKTLQLLKSNNDDEGEASQANDLVDMNVALEAVKLSENDQNKDEAVDNVDFLSLETNISHDDEVRAEVNKNKPHNLFVGPKRIWKPKASEARGTKIEEIEREQYNEFTPPVFNSNQSITRALGMRSRLMRKARLVHSHKCNVVPEPRSVYSVNKTSSTFTRVPRRHCPPCRSSDYEKFLGRTAKHLKIRLEDGRYVVYKESRHCLNGRRRRTLWSAFTENAVRFLSLVLPGKPTTGLSRAQFRHFNTKRKYC